MSMFKPSNWHGGAIALFCCGLLSSCGGDSIGGSHLGPGKVTVPNVVGLTQIAATTAITGAGLVVGAVSTAVSPTVPAGSVISQDPLAATSVTAGSAVNLTVSGAAAGFAFVSNAGDGTLSVYSINLTSGALTPLAGSPFTVVGAALNGLAEIKVDPSGKFLYVAEDASPGALFAYVINSDGTLTAVQGSPFAAADGTISLAFDATGAYLYTANAAFNNGVSSGTVSAYAINPTTGVLMPLANSPYTLVGTNPEPTQIVSAGNYLYVTDANNNTVDVLAVTSGTGELTQNVAGSPFATDVGPYSLVAAPSGAWLYTANSGPVPQGQIQGPGSLSAFAIDVASGHLNPLAGNPLALAVANFMAIDPLSKFLFLTESSAAPAVNGVSVYAIDSVTGGVGAKVPGSPFATGVNPFSVSIDPSGKFVYVGNDQDGTVSEFTLNSGTGVLSPVAGSPVAAGTFPDHIAIQMR